MANTVGKITGQMLESNLVRRDMQSQNPDDDNLRFDYDLLFLDVWNNRVGINTDTPFRDLLVNGDIASTNVISDSFSIPNFLISGNTITNTDDDILLSAADPGGKITANRLRAGQIEFDGQTISSTVSNADIELHTSGSGQVYIYNQLDVQGDLHATGNIVADGNLVLGDSDTDNIIFNADFVSDLIPDITNTYSIGTPSKQFGNMFTYLINGQNFVTGGAIVGGIDIGLRPGNTLYVSTNGSDSNVGDHPNGPYRTIKHALSQATSGDTVYIYSGSYLENFPLTVPVGVTVKGEGLRSVTIQPAVDSETDDVFKLNGETTVTDLTIKNFGGFGFSFDNNFTVTSRSPYIQNVSLITNTTLYPKVTLNDPNPDANSQSDNFGFYLDASPSYIIAGARGENSSSGIAYIYDLEGNLLHTLTNPNSYGTSANDSFGQAVAITELYAIVGAPNEDTATTTNSGRAYIYSTATGALLHTLTPPATSNRQFGITVGISESYSIVGCYQTSNVFIYSNATGSLLHTITLPTGIGRSVDITDSYAIIGTPSTNSFAGRAFIYNASTGTLLYTLLHPGPSPIVGDAFGSKVALSDSYAVVTAPLRIGGVAYVYNLSNGTLLHTINNPNAYGGATSDAFGGAAGGFGISNSAAAISDSFIVVGADFEDDDSGSAAGKAYVFNTQTAELMYTIDNPKAFGTTAGDQFGKGVALSGTTVVVSAPYEGDSTYTSSGKVFIYDLYKGGALIDGSKATVSSKEASMLFHSVTMIIPNSYGLAMSNGVRVEWLNSFIYYAYKGLYGINGSSGFASLGLKFGAEVRSIGSANVYGTYGAWADGAEVLMYLINHNFGYIGSGLDNNNDPTDTIQANELVTLNNGKIYYQSVDHKGDFRVGDVLLIEQSTGRIVLDTFDITSNSITIQDGTNTTYIDPTTIQTGNIQISGNTISSTINQINLSAFNSTITVSSNLTVQNFSETQNFTANGNTNLGNSSTSNVTVNSRIDSNLLPNNSLNNIGSFSLPFNELFAERLLGSDIIVDGNAITTTQSNSDLELRANGTGNILINDTLTLNQNLNVSGLSTFLTANISNTLTANGPLVLTNYTVDEYNNGQILITDNFITTTESNSPLELRAQGLGGIIFDQVLKVTDATISNSLTSGTESQRSIIFTPQPGKYLDISTDKALKIASGTAATRTLSNAEIRYNTVNNLYEGGVTGGTKSLVGLYDVDKNTYITAENSPGANDNTIRMYANGILSSIIDNNKVQFNNLFVDEIRIDANTISTFNTNADLVLEASGTGLLNINNNFTIDTSSFTNTNLDAVTTINSTGVGYVKFDGAGAIRVPSGTDAERPVGVPVGSTRYNTDQAYLEVWDGTTWNVATGGGPIVTAQTMEELGDIYALIFG